MAISKQILIDLERYNTPALGIEPRSPGGAGISNPVQYHYATQAMRLIISDFKHLKSFRVLIIHEVTRTSFRN